MQEKKYTVFEWVALGVVGGMSLLNIVTKIMWGWNDSFIISVVGLFYWVFHLPLAFR